MPELAAETGRGLGIFSLICQNIFFLHKSKTHDRKTIFLLFANLKNIFVQQEKILLISFEFVLIVKLKLKSYVSSFSREMSQHNLQYVLSLRTSAAGANLIKLLGAYLGA